MDNHEFLRADNPVGISVRNLTVKSNGSPILNDISFDLEPKTLTAIMGGSGSGKTTLLNVLSQRTNVSNKKLEFEGGVIYGTDHSINYAYMQQTDTFLPGLTIFETLKFQADLRLSHTVPDHEKVMLVNSLLDVLELSHRKDEIIASFTYNTNLSGGEQRRVSVAIQLLLKPSLLFLDEPTTGLDTSSSLKLVEQLKKLTAFGLTIILSIHQPRPEITVYFDNICLLSKGGRLVYFGNIQNSSNYFKNIRGNPIEYIMDLSVKDTVTKSAEIETELRIQNLVNDWKKYQTVKTIEHTPSFNDNLSLFKRHYPIPFWKEVIILTKRSLILTYRDWMSLVALNGGSIFMAVSVGWMFYKPYPDLAGIRSITSQLYVMLEVLGFCPSFFELERLWYTDGKYFLREYSEGYVSSPGFMISRRLAKLILEDAPTSMLFGIITYFMWGLRSGGVYLGVYLAVCLLIHLLGMVMALMIFAMCKEFGIGALIYSAIYQLQNSACGYFVNAKTMPVYVRWTKYIAYFWYAFGALLSNQYTNWVGACPFDNEAACVEYTGNYQLEVIGFPQNWIAEPIGILVAWFVGVNLITFVFLYYKNFDIKFAKTRENKFGGDDEHHLKPETSGLKSPISEDFTGIDIDIEKINLMKKDYAILNDISASFLASSVNVIMGPSGSGKTTLLNFLSNRISRWSLKTTGTITVNNTLITPQQLKNISGYVTQHDDSLQATLTVRETLYYQAKLRIPVEEHSNIPNIISRLIREMGLSDCAETLIGTEYVKGISGGEKRRVSIAVQLLSRPKILFLDEPTSGLDSKTAASILSLLNKVAEQHNTTMIVTIHQPSSEMFLSFGSVLLLARGGRVVFNGDPSDIEGHMKSQGYSKPENFNVADFLLDLVSGGIDEDVNEVSDRVVKLVSEWSNKSLVENSSSEYKWKSNEITEKSFDFKQFVHKRTPMAVSLPTIIRRQMISTYRDKEMIITRSAQTLILTVVHTLYFAPLRNNEAGIANRLGLIQEVLNLYFVGLVCSISVYPSQKNLFYQEYRDGIYGVTEFSIGYFVNELPTEIIPTIFFSALIVFGVGLPRTPAMFFTMFATGFMSLNAGESLGIMVQSCFNHMGVATNILTNIIILAIFMGGTMSIYMPMFFKVINYINPMKYAVGVSAVLGFKDQVFDCLAEQCLLSTGDDVLRQYKLDINYGAFFGGLVATFIIYRAIATLLIWVRVRYFN